MEALRNNYKSNTGFRKLLNYQVVFIGKTKSINLSLDL